MHYVNIMIKNILIVGMGEIGRPLYEIIEENSEYNVYGDDLNIDKCSPNLSKIPNEIDVMHICIPCNDIQSFIKVVSTYYKRYKPKILIINSTVPPRTTYFVADVLQSDCCIAHSPMFGRHEDKDFMKSRMKTYIRLIGGINKESSDSIEKYYKEFGFRTKVVSSPLESELMKIMETTYAGWMITFFNEFHRTSEFFGANFVEVVDALAETYYPRCEKPVWYPDVITGHCIMQNIDLLLSCYDAGFLQFIKESSELRKEEVQDEKIKKDIKEIKDIRHKILKGHGIHDRKS
jgi:UDP-N-acetyl-D-mannosaminuronate dehydrogenase